MTQLGQAACAGHDECGLAVRPSVLTAGAFHALAADKGYAGGSRPRLRYTANHLRNIASVSITSVNPACMIFTVDT